MRQTQPSRSRLPWLTIVAVAAVIVVVALLVWPTNVDGPLVRLIEVVYATVGASPSRQAVALAGFVANVALFVPVAVLVGVAARRWWLGLAIGVGTSVASELVQLGLPGRNASVEDVIANSLGAVLGVAIALRVLRRQRAHKLDT